MAKGVNSGNFFLGLMYLDGIYVERDVERGLEYLYRGAAKNNAYCFYYLAMLHAEGELVEKSKELEFHYMKRSAEEGFV